MITAANLAEAWSSGYWNGTSHTGPLNDAAVDEKNPHRNANSSEGNNQTPVKKKVLMNQPSKWPATVQAFLRLADEMGVKPSELLEQLERDLGKPDVWGTK
ncbi:hypothetical protein [Arthrobacter sp. TMN-50]